MLMPPVPPPPPAISQCMTVDGQAVPKCAKYIYKHLARSIEAQFVGSVLIDLKSDDVLDVPADSSATIEERTGKPLRRLSVENGKTTYIVDGLERPFDAAARKWLREVLSTMPARPVPPPATSR